MKLARKKRTIAGIAISAALLVGGCGGMTRNCTGCMYKSSVAFSSMPTGTITSAVMEVTVTHSGTCPQSGGPNNCTEIYTYDVKCKVGTSKDINVGFYLDAAASNTSHQAKITVVKGGTTYVRNGTVNMSSNATGGAAPPNPPMPQPCPPAVANPYVSPFPVVQ